MILDLILLVFSWFGAMFVALDFLFKDTEFGFLPWGFIGVVFFVCGFVIVRWRGATTTAWHVLDFPKMNQKLGIMTTGPSIRLKPLLPSLGNWMKTKNDEYYQDTADGAYNFGGHDTRLIDSEVSYTTDPEKARFVNVMEDEFYDYEDMKDAVKSHMVQLRTKDGRYVLSADEEGTEPLLVTDLDIDRVKAHHDLFEALVDQYFIKCHGHVYTLKHYKRFQDRQAAPYQIASVIHYIKANAAMRAAKVKKDMGGVGKYLIIVIIIVVLLLAAFMVMTGQVSLPGV
jgi:hypothetical protein